MAIVSVDQIKEELSFTDDIGVTDDFLLKRKIDAAQNHIERLVGFKVEDEFGGLDQEPIPPALIEAVSQLAAWWYEQREAANIGNIVSEVPFGVNEIVTEFRGWSF